MTDSRRAAHPAFKNLGEGLTIKPDGASARIVGRGRVGDAVMDVTARHGNDDTVWQGLAAGEDVSGLFYRVLARPEGSDVETARARWAEIYAEDPDVMVAVVPERGPRWVCPLLYLGGLVADLRAARRVARGYQKRLDVERAAAQVISSLDPFFPGWWEHSTSYEIRSMLAELEKTARVLDANKDRVRAAAKRRTLLLGLHRLELLCPRSAVLKSQALNTHGCTTLVDYLQAAGAASAYLQSDERAAAVHRIEDLPILASRVSVDLFRLPPQEIPGGQTRWVVETERRLQSAPDDFRLAEQRLDFYGGGTVSIHCRRDNGISQAIYRVAWTPPKRTQQRDPA